MAKLIYENHPFLVIASLTAGIRMFAGKWKLAILWCLAQRPRRFCELTSLLPGVTPKVLAYQLQELAEAGLIWRPRSGVKRQGAYALTESGLDAIPLLHLLREWGNWQLQRSRDPREPAAMM